MKPNRSISIAFCSILCLGLAIAAPVTAQVNESQASGAQPSPAAPAQSTAPRKSDDAKAITIFGRKRLNTMEPGTTYLSGSTGSSCAFISGLDAPVGANSPYGSARSALGPEFIDRNMGGTLAATMFGSSVNACGQSDRNFAAGRAFIAAHDHSLKDAFAAYDAEDYPKALDLFKKSYHKMGFEAAAFMAAKMYLFGTGVPRDTAQAIVWLKKVVEARHGPVVYGTRFNPDDPEAMTTLTDATMTLANIYDMGWDVKADPKEARKWYAKADEFGYVPATHIMGKIHYYGYASQPNVTTAISYFKKAGQIGYAPSQYALGVIYYTGDEGVAPDKKLAGAWLLAASKHGHPDALFAVGRMYDLGEGGATVDPAKALVYYKEAAVKGQPDAQNAVGLSFYTGNGLPQDAVVARKWFQKAAEKGQPDAMFNLAVMLAHGEGGSKDTALAYVWFKLASEGELEKAGLAAAELEPKLTPDDRARADAILNPKP